MSPDCMQAEAVVPYVSVCKNTVVIVMLFVSRARTSHHIDLHFMRSRVIPESSSLVYTCIRRIPPPSSFHGFTVPPRIRHSHIHTFTALFGFGEVSEQDMREGGWDVRARALTCVALGRWVAFGRPKMSVWGRAGAGSAPAKVACNTQCAHPNLELI